MWTLHDGQSWERSRPGRACTPHERAPFYGMDWRPNLIVLL